MTDFSFIDNESWFKPFLISLHEYYISKQLEEQIVDYKSNYRNISNDTNDIYNTLRIFTYTRISYEDAIEFAIYNLNKVFRNTCSMLLVDKPSWKDCIPKETRLMNEYMCRISTGFGNRVVPTTKKFNPIFHQEKHKNDVLLAEYSYKYLYHHREIEEIINTPISDYTRYLVESNVNLLDKIFMANLRYIQSIHNNDNYVESLLSTYKIKVPPDIVNN